MAGANGPSRGASWGLHRGLSPALPGQPRSLSDQGCLGAVSSPAGRGACGAPGGGDPGVAPRPPGPPARAPRGRNAALRSRCPIHSCSPLAQPGAAPSLAAAAGTLKRSAPTMQAQLWLLQLLLLGGVARALSPATPAGRMRWQGRCRPASGTRDVVRGRPGTGDQAPYFPRVLTEGAHDVEGPSQGSPEESQGPRSYRAAFVCLSMFFPAATLGCSRLGPSWA